MTISMKYRYEKTDIKSRFEIQVDKTDRKNTCEKTALKIFNSLIETAG